LKTGDLFRVGEQGFFYFVARLDDMFVCGGENLYPKEVENLILKHPDVADVVVVPLPHTTKGEAPVAAVVCHAGRELSTQQVQDFCAAHGPTFAVPRAVLLLPKIPTNGAGKPDRRQVRTILAEQFGTLTSRALN
jgi:long-chain acyl-CoA synthetase